MNNNDSNDNNDSDCDEQTVKCAPRFKVVKLVSSQPYRVGRWLCVEFTDDQNVDKAEHNHNNCLDASDANPMCGAANESDNNDNNENSGDDRLASTEGVAIDNKIEQAMDLVKSHLMFAVREEVDVLRERITELNARVEQLEHENALLRAHVSHETLNLLQLN